MYKNLEKVYVERFEDINRNENLENKLYVLKYPHDKHYRKWIYNKWCNRLEPLTWLDKLFEFKHAPAKLDKVDNSHDYIKVDNINRTQADGLDPELFDVWQQHLMIDTKVLDSTLDDLAAHKHVPGKIDKKEGNLDYIKVENINRTQADGLAEGLIDDKQQHFIIDTSKLDETLNNIDNPKGQHVPSKLDKEDHSHTYILVENKNRTADDGLEDGLVDEDGQLHVINTKGLDDALDNVREQSHAPGKIDMVEGSKDYISVKNENRSDLEDTKQQHYLLDTTKLDSELAKSHVPAKMDKLDNLYDYITVKNENRTTDDGLPAGLVDALQQHLLMDTSKLDLFLNSLELNNGLEVVIAGSSKPDDDTSIEIGDITRFNDIKIYYRAGVFSVTQEINTITPIPGQRAQSSFIFTNIGDKVVTPTEPLTGEIGQTLCYISEDLTKATIDFYNSIIWRFNTSIGTGENGAFNIIDGTGVHVQPGGKSSFGVVKPPHTSTSNRKGWLEVIKVTGVVYGTTSAGNALNAIIERLAQRHYVEYQDFNRYLKYAMSSKAENQLGLLDHIEQFKEQLEQEPLPNVSQAKIKTYYDYLLAYREELKENE